VSQFIFASIGVQQFQRQIVAVFRSLQWHSGLLHLVNRQGYIVDDQLFGLAQVVLAWDCVIGALPSAAWPAWFLSSN